MSDPLREYLDKMQRNTEMSNARDPSPISDEMYAIMDAACKAAAQRLVDQAVEIVAEEMRDRGFTGEELTVTCGVAVTLHAAAEKAAEIATAALDEEYGKRLN